MAMKRDEKTWRRLNAFLKHTKGKCPIIAYAAPLAPVVECIIKHHLASGICYCNIHDGKEIDGSWFNVYKIQEARGPGGIRKQTYPDWEEVIPPGRPIPMDAPIEYIYDLSQESIELIKKAKLFFYALIYYGTYPDFFKAFGARYIPGMVMEADQGVFPHIRKTHAKRPITDRDEVYRLALDYIKKAFEDRFPYGLSGSGVKWYQGAQITKQKRWDHEIANGNFQVQVAFLRGVSQQHDMPFIIYVAPMGNSPDGLWGTMVDPETPFAKVFNCTYFSGGKPEHLLEREWFYSWFSGPAAVVLEATEYYFFKKGKDKNIFEPGLMAEAARKLNHLAYASNFDRGIPYRPACILMDERHGWELPSSPDAHNWDPPEIMRRKIWGIFDYTHQDIMVDNFFGAVYPGYEYGGSWGHKYGDLVQTPYGDSFDVLMSNAGLKALQKYSVIFLIGKPKLTGPFKKRLEQYVLSGGKLILNISQVDYEWQKFLGVRLKPRYNRWYMGLGTLRASDYSEWLNPNQLWKESRYHYSRIEAKGAEILAVSEQGDPLVVCRKYGKGKVYLVTAHFMQEISGFNRPNGLLNISKFLVGYVLSPYQKLRIRGPLLNYMVNKTSNGLAIMLFNNRGEDWNGWITVPGMAGAEIKEWYKGEHLHTYSASSDLAIRLRIPGYSLRILSVKNRG